jgi:uncharacterized protein YjbI with pentapeptide repeats
MVAGERVEFDGCHLGRSDFYAARLSSARLVDSDLTEAEFSKADLPEARLHGSRLDGIKGAVYLKGVVADSSQVLPLAMSVFAALHITIDDER